MFTDRDAVKELMNTEKSLLSFISRVNDAYVASHSIHDLVNDSEYQKLTIKHGKVKGTPLGNRHILPGYWFTAFVAPYESFQRVLETLKYEQEQHQNAEKDISKNGEQAENSKEEVLEETKFFKKLAGLNPLQFLIEKFQTDIECLVSNIESLDETKTEAFPNKKSLKRVVTAISTGSYEFSEEDDLTCTFFDNDSLCGYRFEAKIKVAIFNQFAIDFSKQLIELLWPIIERHKTIKKEVANMLIGQVFFKEH